MHLYLLRHGEAEPRKPGVADEGRALTRRGKQDVRTVLKAARCVMDPPQLILTSPLRRARETAAEATALFAGCPVHVTERLKPSAAPVALGKMLSRHPANARLLLVGHEPHLSLLLAFLLETPVAVDFKKGALICLERPGSLKWMLTPKLARGL